MNFGKTLTLAVAGTLMGTAAATAVEINLLCAGNSITQGAGLSDPAVTAPPARCAELLRAMPGIDGVNLLNAGLSGSTTTDWAPADATLYPRFTAMADTLVANHPGALTVVSISLGTNDSACDRCKGAPATRATLRANLRSLTDSLLTRYPGSIAVLHTPLWYSPNTYNGARYLREGQSRLLPFRAEIEDLVGEYALRAPGRVWLGDTLGYALFERDHASLMQAEQGHAGTFYLHPDEKGASTLGALWAAAVKAAIDQSAIPAYLNPAMPLESRVADALARMTLDEKIAMIHAQSKFSSPGVPRLGIPEVWCTDGPHGIRADVYWDRWISAGQTNDSIVAFPALTCLAATWDPSLALLYGNAISEEALYRGKSVLLGPGVNICRTPLGGRNFEYMGEDPLLASRMVAPYIRGVQANGVAACVKHYALNNHEQERHHTNVRVDDRALREIYLPAFEAAVKDGGAWAVMGAYNLKDDQHLCHNKEMLADILKGEWGFDGVVVSDWGGTHDTMQAVTNGLDLEYGTWTDGMTEGLSDAYRMYYMADPYLELIRGGKLGTDELDDKCRRVLRLIFRTTMAQGRPHGSINSEAHYAAARRIASEGIVLLKNDPAAKGAAPLLPADPGTRDILVVGENAMKMMTVGGGSSSLKAQREVTPLDALRAMVPAGTTVRYERGYVGDTITTQDGVSTGQNLADPRDAATLLADAAEAARHADLVIFMGGLNKANHNDCESDDRPSLALPYGQDALIEALAKANPRLVVVNLSGNAVAMPWADRVPAIVQTWYNGSEAGSALADVLLGRVNPSGKLPMTFYATLEQCAAHAAGEASYPGVKRPGSDIWDTDYAEGIYVGYRATDRAIAAARGAKARREAAPLFPFGHGLSYTSFAYGDIRPSASEIGPGGKVTFTIPVTNTGTREGAETVQLYISAPAGTPDRPVKELKGFAKVHTRPGQTADAVITVDASDLAVYDPSAAAWTIAPGTYTVTAAASAADPRSATTLTYRP